MKNNHHNSTLNIINNSIIYVGTLFYQIDKKWILLQSGNYHTYAVAKCRNAIK